MNRSIQERALFKVLEDLRDYLPYLVLIGGWVPYIYRNYLWKGEVDKPYLTADIDIGIRMKIENFTVWLPWQDDVRTFFENTTEDIRIPAYTVPI